MTPLARAFMGIFFQAFLSILVLFFISLLFQSPLSVQNRLSGNPAISTPSIKAPRLSLHRSKEHSHSHLKDESIILLFYFSWWQAWGQELHDQHIPTRVYLSRQTRSSSDAI